MLWNTALLLGSLLALTLGAELLVRGAASIASRSRISPAFIGLTVIGFGTSTPELCTSVLAGIRGVEDIALGNVVGSNIFNIAVILGLTAIVHPVAVQAPFIRREGWVVILVATIPFGALLSGGTLGRLAGFAMLLGLVAYLWRAYRASRAIDSASQPDPVALRSGKSIGASLALVLAGVAVLAGGSHVLVSSARSLAAELGMSELAIGLTVVAAGTSAPELVTSLVAAARGQVDLAVGNIIGSNIFNLLGIFGLTCVIQPQAVNPQVLMFDAPVLLLASAALLPIMRSAGRISRLEGAALGLGYCIYVTLLITLLPRWFPPA